MKLLILGADGQVGRGLRESLRDAGELIAATRTGEGADEACDLADAAAVSALLSRVTPTVIVNAAAYTAVDKAEEDIETAEALNAGLPSILGHWAALQGARVVHYSTDYVFDGTAADPYPESAPTAPLGVYGRSKLDGEQRLATSGCRHLILRTAWIYGPIGRNFLKTMLRLAGERDQLNIVGDQRGTPTSAPWIADATRTILDRWTGAPEDGIYHLTASGQTTWHGFALEIVTYAARLGLLERAPKVNSISTADYPTPASRPAYSVLDGARIETTFGIERPEWVALVHRILDRMASISS